MKSTKNPIKPKSNKDQLGESKLIAGIQTFFKPVPKTFVIEENNQEEKSNDGDKMFYVSALKEKLRRQHTSEESKVACKDGPSEKANCNDMPPSERQFESGSASIPDCSECVQKDLAISEWQRKYNDLKKVHAKQSIHFSELYSKHNDLLKSVENINKPTAEEAASSTDMFSPNEVKYLQCMDLAKKNDCTFVHHCLKFAYKNDVSVMATRTLWGTASKTGTSKNGEDVQRDAKGPLTPEKVRRIKALFADRISKCTIDSVEYEERMKDPYVNRLLAAGIKNLASKYKEI